MMITAVATTDFLLFGYGQYFEDERTCIAYA